jgi:predicted dehydrogenase
MVDDWRDVSVLIIGCGSIGRRHGRVLRGLGVRDLRACDPMPEQRAAFSAESPSIKMYDSFEAGLADRPQTVFVCTPPWLHIPQAMQAINAGCHVFSEKPLSDKTDGIDDLIALAAAKSKKVMVGLCFRYHAGQVKARSYLDAGRVGRLVSIRAMVGEHLPDVRPDYQTLFSAQTGGAFDLMHEVDLAIWHAGAPVRRVLAVSGNYSDIGIKAPDLAEILLEFDNHCLASIHLDFFQRPRRRQTELVCTAGVILVEFARWDLCTVSMYEASSKTWTHEEFPTDRDDMFRAEDQEFLQAVAEDKPIRYTAAEARKSVDVVLAAQ